MPRTYTKAKRLESQDETREKIVRATKALHLQQGVATTSYSDVAALAGVGAATVYRHFPSMGLLVDACGAHIWHMIDPPGHERAGIFSGMTSQTERLEALVQELETFFSRGTAALLSAMRDGERVPELALFLNKIRHGLLALTAEALKQSPKTQLVVAVAAVSDFKLWLSLSEAGFGPEKRKKLMLKIIEAAIAHEKQTT